MSGIVYLVGAGPGDPGLVTVRGAACLARADVVIADHLASPRLLALAPASAERHVRGARRSGLSQEAIVALMIERARAGRVVVRLKGGDPFVFGRGGEEASAVLAAGLRCEVVPGVTAGIAATAYAGIPLTHRGAAGAVAFVTAHEADKEGGHVAWEALAAGATTLVLYMSLDHLDAAMRRLAASGAARSTPAAVVSHGTRPSQRTLVGTVGDIAARARQARLASPALTVVGDVVRLRPSLSWFEGRPLHGARVLCTRAPDATLSSFAELEALGAEIVHAPAIAIAPPESWAPLDAALAPASLARYRLVALASANGVRALFERLAHAGVDARALAGKAVAAVGEATAAALLAQGIRADVVAHEASAEGLARALAPMDLAGSAALLPRAEAGRELLEAALRARGVTVDAPVAYRSLPAPPASLAWVAELLDEGALDAVTFGSPRTAEALLAAVGGPSLLSRTLVAAIGPTTARALEAAGVRVDVVPDEQTFEALGAALVAPLAARLAARRAP